MRRFEKRMVEALVVIASEAISRVLSEDRHVLRARDDRKRRHRIYGVECLRRSLRNLKVIVVADGG